MANKVLALTEDGRITYCTSPPELRGRGRCNHVAHQQDGQSVDEFIDSIQNDIAQDGEESGNPKNQRVFQYSMEEHLKAVKAIPDNTELTVKLVSEYGIARDPDWKEVVSSIQNPFVIGSKRDGTWEEAEMVDFQQSLTEGKNSYALMARYRFRGKIYEVDFGEVPVVAEDGTISINGSKWRVLPVLEQRNAGVVSYPENVVIKQQSGHVAMVIPKDPDAEGIKIYGKVVPKETVLNYWKTGNTAGLESGQIWALDNIDPVALERFPDLKENLDQFKSLPPDEIGDISKRQLVRYEDMVQEQIALQMRRMGVTFRTNLEKQRRVREAGNVVNEPQAKGEYTEQQLEETLPLFYQRNLTENIKKDLVGRSNVQNAESLNPISALTQAQKISLTGRGGYSKDSAPYELRLPHPSHEGIIDPLVASSGKNVGLTACASGGYIGKDRFLHRKPEGDTLSPSDFIPYKLHDDPSRANMACAHLTQACPIVGGEDPIVTTPAWEKIRGAKIGTNLRVAYTSDKDCFEDAVKISESAAAKMGTVQVQQYRCFDQRDLGILKVGQRLERKMQIGGTEVKYGGVVKSVGEDSFEVETVYAMSVGDKLSNRHGGKSVVARVVPDKEMPHILDESTGKLVPAEIVMTPLGVVGRKNLGQVLECNEGAAKVGLHVDSDGKPSINRTSTVVANGKKVEATAGVEYVMRLNHIAEKTLSSHADELSGTKEYEGVRLGEMEAILLSTDADRLKILNYLRHQEAYDSHQKLNSLLHSIGVDMTGVNWN
jgi:hypothetical protein